MGAKLARALAIGLWVGLLTLLLQVRAEKIGDGAARFEAHLERAPWIAGGIAGLLVVAAVWRRVRAGAATGRLASRSGELAARSSAWLSGSAGRRFLLAALPLALAAALPLTGNDYYISVAAQTAIYAGLALGLNMVVGQAGLLVLGYAAFYAAGAYTYAILNRDLGLPFWLGLPAGALVAALLGLGLGAPTLRLKGDYLAIVTLGFGEMMRIVLNTSDRLTGGPNGIFGIDGPSVLGREFSGTAFYWLALGLVAVTAVVASRLNQSRLGRAWVAMREDETAALAMGINITHMRLWAFSLSAMWAGLCGVFFAAKQAFISPESFTFNESVTVLAMVVLGGMGSIPGVILGAVILGLLPEVLRGVSDYRMLALGVLMITMMIFRPQGLVPNVRRRLELEAAGGTPGPAPAREAP